MRLPFALSAVVLVLVLVAGCGGGNSTATRTTANADARCAHLLQEARTKLPPPQAGAYVGQMNAGCSSVVLPQRTGDAAEQARFHALEVGFADVAGHRVPDAVGYSCHNPGVMRTGDMIACSVTLQSRRRQADYAVRLLAGGCWRAISLSGGADLAGCRRR